MLTNKAVEHILEHEKTLGNTIRIDDIMAEVAGIYPKVMIDGDAEAGAWSCGMVAGLIHDIPSVQALIDQIMAEAHNMTHKRLSKL